MLTIFYKIGKIYSMNSNSIVHRLAVLALFALVMQSCGKRTNGIDNNQVITKPYSLYVADTNGGIWNTNDGINYKKLVYSGGGLPTRSIVTADSNILFMGYIGAYYSPDFDGDYTFNVATSNVNPFAYGQSSMLTARSFKRVFLAGSNPGGVLYSDSSGKVNTWKPDTSPALSGATVSSYTQLKGGTVIGYDDVNKSAYSLANTSVTWSVYGAGALPATGNFFISHFNDDVVAADVTGVNGVYYSRAGGSWTAYTGIPANTPVLCANAPFEQTLLIGTNGGGVFRLQTSTNTFVAKNNGLHDDIIVTGIVGKEDVYKNGAVKQYVYLSTNKGVYVSYDLGENWVRIKTGNFVAIN